MVLGEISFGFQVFHPVVGYLGLDGLQVFVLGDNPFAFDGDAVLLDAFVVVPVKGWKDLEAGACSGIQFFLGDDKMHEMGKMVFFRAIDDAGSKQEGRTSSYRQFLYFRDAKGASTGPFDFFHALAYNFVGELEDALRG